MQIVARGIKYQFLSHFLQFAEPALLLTSFKQNMHLLIIPRLLLAVCCLARLLINSDLLSRLRLFTDSPGS